MCGIVGYTGSEPAKPYLLNGLQKLEYRGYDSAGLALSIAQDFLVRRCAGVVQGLIDATADVGKTENQGIAHTRWATHGAPTENNAHPHRAGDLILVHNGIIENHSEIRSMLSKSGVTFQSQTDTEVFAKLIEFERNKTTSGPDTESKLKRTLNALSKAMQKVEGHYSILLMSTDLPQMLIGVQNGAPLVAATVKTGSLIASDIQAIMQYSQKVCFVPKGAILIATDLGLKLFNSELAEIPVQFETIDWSAENIEKTGYESFMLKEIFQQPSVIADTLTGRLPKDTSGHFIWDDQAQHEQLWSGTKRLFLIACGTSYHAALTAKYFFEKWAQLDVQVDVASEFRYRSPVFEPGTTVGVISQSGETADTLAALRLANQMGAKTFSICNVPMSTISRESTIKYATKAGPEIGVASTKAFTAQLTMLCALALDVGRLRGKSPVAQEALQSGFQDLARLPHELDKILSQSEEIQKIGALLKDKRIILFVGRGTMYPIALEGALKMKELTYLPSEGFAAGELKHGPIAYIDKDVAIVTLVPKDDLYLKTLSNLEEIRARGGLIVSIGNDNDENLKSVSHAYIGLPQSSWGTMPILAVIPLQLLAYGCAKALGRNIDKPRNLAKSVTVE